MGTAELRSFFRDQAMYHVHSPIPKTGRNEQCRSSTLYCHGSCFVNELPADQLLHMQLLINRTKAAEPDKPILLYSHSSISTACPGHKPPFWSVKRPARPVKTPIQIQSTTENAKGT